MVIHFMTPADLRTDSTLPATGLKVRVLLVEDHADTATLMARLLERHGFSVRAAGTVADALRTATEERFDVIVSDIGLPDGDGYELMEQVRDRHRLPGIAVTGHASEDDVLRSHAAGFMAHVSKPVDVTKLIAVIARVVQRAD